MWKFSELKAALRQLFHKEPPELPESKEEALPAKQQQILESSETIGKKEEPAKSLEPEILEPDLTGSKNINARQAHKPEPAVKETVQQPEPAEKPNSQQLIQQAEELLKTSGTDLSSASFRSDHSSNTLNIGPFAFLGWKKRPALPAPIHAQKSGKQTMLQGFEWYLPEDGKHWNRLASEAGLLEEDGYTMVWMPPAYKGQAGIHDVGYGVYDLYDLGEFNQKGSVRTKYGTKEEYLNAIQNLQDHHIKALADIVIDHRMGADSTETVQVRNVDAWNRMKFTSGTYPADIWCHFDFPGRKKKYSQFVWNASCFNGADYNAKNGQGGIMLFDGKSWNKNVSTENGNYDYVMGACTDFHEPWVTEELHRWGKWYTETTHIDGFRLDCLKSIDYTFFDSWLKEMENIEPDKDFTVVGEYWSGNIDELCQYLDHCHHSMKLFDVPLHFHLYDCSKSGGRYDVRTIFNNTLCQKEPDYAVAFVDNHDTQPMQALCSWIDDWFKTSAYACILLYKAKTPCVFWGDRKGIEFSHNGPVALLEEMVWIRSHLMGDEIVDLYDEDWQKACWMVLGEHPLLVLFTIGDAKSRSIHDKRIQSMDFVDVARPDHHILVSDSGDGLFDCAPGCCSIYIPEADYALMEHSLHHNHNNQTSPQNLA